MSTFVLDGGHTGTVTVGGIDQFALRMWQLWWDPRVQLHHSHHVAWRRWRYAGCTEASVQKCARHRSRPNGRPRHR